MLHITLNHQCHNVNEGTTVKAFLESAKQNTNNILGVFCQGNVLELAEPLISNAELTPITYDSEEGKRIYERTLCLLVIYVARKLFPELSIEIDDAVGKSLAFHFKNKVLSPCEIESIEYEMNAIVALDMPIVKHKWSVDKAIGFFEKENQADKVALFNYRRTPFISMYELDGVFDYFYGAMLPSTGYLKHFKLSARYPGMLISYPSDEGMQVENAQNHKKQYRIFEESKAWCDILHVSTVAELNHIIECGKMREFIRVNEALHDKSIAHIANEVVNAKARIVLIFGPSCSGKTTFTHRLDVHLRVHGLDPIIISLDDFYKNRDTLPKLPNGEVDLETVNALDLESIEKCFTSLIAGQETEVPMFDFKTGTRKPHGRKVKITSSQPILVEGIHAMNDSITAKLPSHLTYGVYVSPLTCLKLDDHNRVHTSDARLLRRIVRDMQFRGTPVAETINMWKSVREGEMKWIYPNQEKADIIFNTALHYELPLLHSFIYNQLEHIGVDDKNYLSARRIVKSLNYLLPIGEDVMKEIPPLSILREFIGGCSFYIRD